MDLIQSKHPSGDIDIDDCKYECIIHSKCFAFDWHGNSDGVKCYLMLVGTLSVNGSSVRDPAVPSNHPQQTKSHDSSCHIKPTTGAIKGIMQPIIKNILFPT